ncbi:MAG: protein phosphatase methylesterase 1 [Benjaminiella poitrasii]|nr:MAG: protein phosphatase methylesterase 1 [Benjaminiella poitrasii]
MSSLQKEMFKKSALPPLDSLREHENDSNEEQHSDITRRTYLNDKYSPSQWNDYFEESLDITIPNTRDISFLLLYYCTNITIMTICLSLTNSPNRESGPTFVMHHGAGSSALTFGLVASHIKELTQGECGVIAFDCRGHGASKTTIFDSDFSLETLTTDLIHIINETIHEDQDIILIGHSMGGSVIANAACQRKLKNVTGIAVLDVVEGSAMDALSSMTKILNSRPKTFTSYEQAIEWSLRTDTVRNRSSACLSIPALLEPTLNNKLKWITDLIKTQPFWTEWFEGLSEKFLNSGTAKLLMLAGTDRLDKPLTIAQMQGKFQLSILPDAGHFLQEDSPLMTADCLVEFWKRNQRLVLPPKVKI